MTEADLYAVAVPVARQAALFLHLVVFAFAFVLVVQADIAMLRGDYAAGTRDLHADARATAWLLLALWLTGGTLIALGSGFSVSALTASPKIAAKLTVVTILTVNGTLLHLFAFPRLTGELPLSRSGITLCVTLGAVSSVSWLTATGIGVARIIAPLLDYAHYIGLYTTGLGLGLTIAIALVRPHLIRQQGHTAPTCRQPGLSRQGA